MKYLLLIHQRATLGDLSEDDVAGIMAEVDAIMAELSESGELVGGEGLVDPASARIVRVQGGQPVVSDGPYLESKEHFAGYLAIDVASVERAVEIASRWPDLRFGGTMEVRAVASGPPEE